VASVADLLLTLLPAGTLNVPAPLRYTIARGLEAVEAPRFNSLDEFSTALARFERGASRDVLRGLVQRGTRPSRPIAATPAPAVEEHAPVAPRPSVVPPRPILVVRGSSASSSKPPQPIAAEVAMFTSLGADGEAGSPRRWALAAAALLASFAVGFAVVDVTVQRRATKPSAFARVLPAASTDTPVTDDAAAKPSQVELREEIVRVPEIPAVARGDGLDDRRSAPVEHAGEQVGAIEAVRSSTANAFSPAFASDGTAIFFHTGRERDARSAIEVATPASEAAGDLGIMTIVDDGSHNYHAQPSPDGRFVAFDSDRDGARAVYVANRDGSQVRKVSGEGYAAVPTWSRNNEWLAYIRAEADNPSVWNVWVQPAAGGRARRVTNYRYGQTWGASWFPDDRRIAYSHEDTLTVMDLQSGKATRYRTPVKGRLVRTPAVSPDGSKIIFQVVRDGAWLLDLADGSMQRVLTDPTAEEFAWAPDGRRVAFHSRRDGQWGIYVLLRS
jgi:hypothetical protein